MSLKENELWANEMDRSEKGKTIVFKNERFKNHVNELEKISFLLNKQIFEKI